MKKILLLSLFSLFFYHSQLLAQIFETHEFGETSSSSYVYAEGLTFNFMARNNMTVETVDVKSVLASEGGTFYIEIYINGTLIADWDQYVSSTTFSDYHHSKPLSIPIQYGDTIQYIIWGGAISTPVGSIQGINYVKLSGGGGGPYDLAFTSLSDMSEGRYGLGYASDGIFLYATGGGINSYPWRSTTMERYSPITDNWIEFATGLIPRRYCSAEYIPSLGNLYVFNGKTDTELSYTDTVEIIDGAGNITYSNSNPYPVEYSGSAVWDEKIYVFGGKNDAGYSYRLYEYDPQSGNWVRLADMPEQKQTNGEVVDGVLYIFGGYSGASSNRIDAYNIQDSTWSSLGTMPIEISAHAVTRIGKNIWIVGTYEDIHFLALYNTETNEFSTLTSNMTGRRHCGAAVIGDELYVFGGNQTSADSTTLNSLQSADISPYNFGIEDDLNSTSISSICYPNPFHGLSTIEFILNQRSKTSLTIYSQLGNMIEVLVDDDLREGKHQVVFDGSNLPSGMYFYIIRSGKFTETNKIMIQ